MFLKYLFIFSLFSLVGWFLELLYRSITNKKFINPGFMIGPVVPLYGTGAVLLTIICNLLNNIKSDIKIFIIFIISMIIMSFIEYLFGFILKKFFHLKLWDYSSYKFNLNGYICLQFSLIWGLLSLIYYTFIYKYISLLSLEFINTKIGLFTLGIFTGIFIIDLSVSIDILARLRKQAKELMKIIDIEKLKIEIRRKEEKEKILKTFYKFIFLNAYLIKKINRKK